MPSRFKPSEADSPVTVSPFVIAHDPLRGWRLIAAEIDVSGVRETHETGVEQARSIAFPKILPSSALQFHSEQHTTWEYTLPLGVINRRSPFSSKIPRAEMGKITLKMIYIKDHCLKDQDHLVKDQDQDHWL